MQNISIKNAAAAVLEANKEAAKANTKRRAGQMFNDRLVTLVKPRLPMMARGY